MTQTPGSPKPARSVLRRVVGPVRRRVDEHVDRRARSLIADDPKTAALIRGHRDPDLTQLVADEVTRQLPRLYARDFTLGVLLGERVQYKRTLTKAGYLRLRGQITELTGIESLDWQMTEGYRGLIDAESRGLGRIAGNTYNVLGKLVVSPLLDVPEGPMLEIGTLYGLFAPALLRQFGRVGQFRHLTVVDPFTGLQMQGGEDGSRDLTRTPVDQDVAEWNFRHLGLADDDVRIITGLSTDPEIQAAAGDRKYAVVVIDGDHFEEGIAKDLRWVENILLPGGIAVVDDYGDRDWLGVQAATDKYLAAGGKMTMIGTVSTSAYLRMPADS